MHTHIVDSHIFFLHSADEVDDLDKAAIPMAEYIAIVASPLERKTLKRILKGKYFRLQDARKTKNMLLRACKYARAHLSDFFPILQAGIVTNALVLENATIAYWNRFERLREEVVPAL